MKFLSRLAMLLLRAIPTVFVIVTLGFFLMHLAPGDIVDFLASEAGAASAESNAALRESLGLDRSLFSQLYSYYSNLAHGSLGMSLRFGVPVTDLILERLPSTLLLVATAIAIAVIFGIAAGTVMALNAGRAKDRTLSVITLIFYSLPSFWVGLMLMIVFAVQLGWLPTGGAYTVYKRLEGVDFVLDRLKYLVLPAVSLALYYIAIYARLTRASVLDVRNQDYVRTAVAKGLNSRQVTMRHILRNALIPVTTMAGMHIAGILGGSVVIETVFGWPGMGRLTFEAVVARDNVLLLGILLFSAFVVILANILVDILHGVLDPRIKAGR
jgi:peptide/nickel transport system permease protein